MIRACEVKLDAQLVITICVEPAPDFPPLTRTFSSWQQARFSLSKNMLSLDFAKLFAQGHMS